MAGSSREATRTAAQWCVYVVECADGTLYTGIICHLMRRLSTQAAGKGAKYTRHRRPLVLRYTEPVQSRDAALRREAAIKNLTRVDKLALIARTRLSHV